MSPRNPRTWLPRAGGRPRGEAPVARVPQPAVSPQSGARGTREQGRDRACSYQDTQEIPPCTVKSNT